MFKSNLLSLTATVGTTIHAIIKERNRESYDLNSTFSKYRDTYNANDFGKKWEEARLASRHRGNRTFSPTC